MEIDELLDLTSKNLIETLGSRTRRRFSRGLQQKPITLIQKLP